MYTLVDTTNGLALARHESYTALAALHFIQFANVEPLILPDGERRVWAQLDHQQAYNVLLQVSPGATATSYSQCLKLVREAVESAEWLVFPLGVDELIRQAHIVDIDSPAPMAVNLEGGDPHTLQAWRLDPQKKVSRRSGVYAINFMSGNAGHPLPALENDMAGYTHSFPGKTIEDVMGMLDRGELDLNKPQHLQSVAPPAPPVPLPRSNKSASIAPPAPPVPATSTNSEDDTMATAKKTTAKKAATKKTTTRKAPAKKAAAKKTAPKPPRAARKTAPKPPAAATGSKRGPQEGAVNGVNPPRAGGKTRQVWDACEKLLKSNKGNCPSFTSVDAELGKADVPDATRRSTYHYWRRAHGFTGRVTD